MPLNLIKGDYIFYAWIDGEAERYEKTIEMLLQQGYVEKSTDYGFQEAYTYYENEQGDTKLVTECLN